MDIITLAQITLEHEKTFCNFLLLESILTFFHCFKFFFGPCLGHFLMLFVVILFVFFFLMFWGWIYFELSGWIYFQQWLSDSSKWRQNTTTGSFQPDPHIFIILPRLLGNKISKEIFIIFWNEISGENIWKHGNFWAADNRAALGSRGSRG